MAHEQQDTQTTAGEPEAATAQGPATTTQQPGRAQAAQGPATTTQQPGRAQPAQGPATTTQQPGQAQPAPAGGPPRATEPPATQPPVPQATEPQAAADPQASGDGSATVQAPAAAETPEDHERQLERDLEELAAKAEKADEYLELAKRTKADFENYRKRAAREAAAAQERGIAKLARELLPAVDNLDRALQAVETTASSNDEQPDGAATLISGIKLVHADVLAALQRAGIERYSPKGEPFDPQRHEAIAQQPVEGAQPGTIVEVYQQGYLLGESVIRPARVVVAG